MEYIDKPLLPPPLLLFNPIILKDSTPCTILSNGLKSLPSGCNYNCRQPNSIDCLLSNSTGSKSQKGSFLQHIFHLFCQY